MGAKGSGPRKQPTKLLKLHGSYREDRHGGRANEPRPSGKPVLPRRLKGAARRHWQAVVPQLISLGVATSLDTPALEALCLAWSVWADEDESWGKRSQALTHWTKLAGRFGLTPSDRAGLTVAPSQTGGDLGELLA